MPLEIEINGPLAASALKVAYKIYTDAHPVAQVHIDPGSDHAHKMIEARTKSVAAIAVQLLVNFSHAIPQEWKVDHSSPPPAAGPPSTTG